MGFGIPVNGPTNEESSGALPAARYLLVVEEVTEDISKSANQMAVVVFGCHDADGVRAGAVKDYYPFHVDWKIKNLCHHLGIRKTAAFELDSDDMLGRQCGGDVAVEEYTDSAGRSRNKNSVSTFALEDWVGDVPAIKAEPEPAPEQASESDGEL